MSEKQIIQKDAAFLSSSMSVDDVVAHVTLVKDAMHKVMVKDEDYGIIEGTKKPTLYKPGAEKLCVLFRLAPSFITTEHFDGNHLTVKSNCILTHINSGKTMGSGDAMCSTKEKKYAKRKMNGKVVDNVELPDCYNTVLKMADKRALVAAVLVVTAASSMFTQDYGDTEKEEPEKEPKEVPTVVVDTTAEVKKQPERAADAPPLWSGKLTMVSPKEQGMKKFIHCIGVDDSGATENLLLERPSDKDKAAVDVYNMLHKDLEQAAIRGLLVDMVYTLSPKKNKLVNHVKIYQPGEEPVF